MITSYFKVRKAKKPK